MTKKRVVTVGNIFNRQADKQFFIRGDTKWRGQLYVEGPPFCSLTREEVYALCTALLDSIEEVQADSA